MGASWPAYRATFECGELRRLADEALAELAHCTACPRRCGADRRAETPSGAFCRTGRWAVVSSAMPHHGEEDCLRGRGGSGTIFLSRCNLRCAFCQNYEISCLGHGRPTSAAALADLMLRLQRAGCHNINLVTPSHVVPQILEALVVAADEGLRIPLVYNTSGYDRVETLRRLDGVVDIYMPDFKFWRRDTAERLADAPDYPEIACEAIKEMHRQVGDLVLDQRGLARRGLLVRHLVMPGCLDETREILRFLAREISPNTLVNVMGQYHPAGRVGVDPAFDGWLDRPLPSADWRAALEIAREEGLRRLARE